MKNIKMVVEGDILNIEIGLSKKQGHSKSGKSMIIATTGGNVDVEGYNEKVKIGINCYTPVQLQKE